MTIILGLESSCDETAAALVDSDRRILAHRVAGQEEEHRPFGGVVPEIAARAHVDRLAPLVAGVLADAGLTLDDVDAIAATRTGMADRPLVEQKIASITVDTHGETYPAPTKLPDPYGRF